MKLLDYTIDRGFLPRLDCPDAETVVRRLVDELVAHGDVTAGADLVTEVLRREREGSTAIGGGLIIPHARFKGLRRVRIAVATLDTPLDIPSEDGRPVDIVILLAGPEDDPRQMLRVLARLARLVKDDRYLDRLRSASTPAGLQAAFGQAGENGT